MGFIEREMLLRSERLKNKYDFSQCVGIQEKDYLNLRNFTQDSIKARQVRDVLNKMKRQIRVNGRKHTATMHYMDNYGYIPMWILVKVLSLGIISELYNILKLPKWTNQNFS